MSLVTLHPFKTRFFSLHFSNFLSLYQSCRMSLQKTAFPLKSSNLSLGKSIGTFRISLGKSLPQFAKPKCSSVLPTRLDSKRTHLPSSLWQPFSSSCFKQGRFQNWMVVLLTQLLLRSSFSSVCSCWILLRISSSLFWAKESVFKFGDFPKMFAIQCCSNWLPWIPLIPDRSKIWSLSSSPVCNKKFLNLSEEIFKDQVPWSYVESGGGGGGVGVAD